MQIRQLEMFINIYHTRSFARTARSMYLTQSRVSQRIKSMEKELGVPLFDRTNHKVIPTERGLAFYTYAQNALDAYRDGILRIKDLDNRFYIHTQVANHLSPINKAFINFSYEYPNISCKILKPVYVGNSMPKGMMAPRHLYLVRKNWVADEEVNFFDLGTPYYSLIMRKDNPLALKEKILMEDLQGKKVVVLVSSAPPKSFGGPYIGRLRSIFYKKDIKHIVKPSISDLLSAIIYEDFNTVALISNRAAFTADLPVTVKRLYVPNDEHIGFAYLGTPSEYMLKFMEMTKSALENQDKEEYI